MERKRKDVQVECMNVTGRDRGKEQERNRLRENLRTSESEHQILGDERVGNGERNADTGKVRYVEDTFHI